ncbi:MAG: KilA-N domain-containing protein [bacterium]|nr:KilA-N domain-containing protein [bacterium]
MAPPRGGAYISFTDIARYRDLKRTNYIIQNWMRSRSTIEFIGLWEQLQNPGFKGIEFDAYKNEAGSNSFSLAPQRGQCFKTTVPTCPCIGVPRGAALWPSESRRRHQYCFISTSER